MMGRYFPYMWLWMLPVFVLFWGVVAALVVVVVRSFSHEHGHDDAALDILRRRLAAGEVTPDEFEKMRKLLQP